MARRGLPRRATALAPSTGEPQIAARLAVEQPLGISLRQDEFATPP